MIELIYVKIYNAVYYKKARSDERWRNETQLCWSTLFSFTECTKQFLKRKTRNRTSQWLLCPRVVPLILALSNGWGVIWSRDPKSPPHGAAPSEHSANTYSHLPRLLVDQNCHWSWSWINNGIVNATVCWSSNLETACILLEELWPEEGPPAHGAFWRGSTLQGSISHAESVLCPEQLTAPPIISLGTNTVNFWENKYFCASRVNW